MVLAAADRDWIPVRRSWRLNGRHYWALQGRNKAEVLQQYGEQQVMLWRRSYDVVVGGERDEHQGATAP